MPLLIHLRQIERKDVVLQGELTEKDLDLVNLDELIRLAAPVEYDLTVQYLDAGILVQGSLWATLACECSRCLKAFIYELNLEDWACHLPLEGEQAVVIKDDCVDLTPYIREDILLELPQRPLCKPDCAGLPPKAGGKSEKAIETRQDEGKPSAWDELNKLKL